MSRFSYSKLREQIGDIDSKALSFQYPNSQVKLYILDAIKRFKEDFEYDFECYGENFIRFKYGSYFFVGLAARRNTDIVLKGKAMLLPRSGRAKARLYELRQ